MKVASEKVKQIYEPPTAEIKPDDDKKKPDDDDGGGGKGAKGNLRLPFGLCERYGIKLPEGATPRDAWNALKGRGITPQIVYNQLDDDDDKDKKTEEKPDNEEKKDKTEKPKDTKTREQYQTKINDAVTDKFSEFSKRYAKELQKSFENFDDNEIKTIANTIEKAKVVKGSGFCRKTTISIPAGTADSLSESLGFKFNASTFYHEYGHYLAYLKGMQDNPSANYSDWRLYDFNNKPEMQEIFKDDAKNLISKLAKQGGYDGEINIDRLSPEVVSAVNGEVASLSGVGESMKFSKPSKPNRNYFWTTDSYNEAMKEYEKKKSLYDSQKEERIKVQANHKRMGFLSDFVAGATKGEINPYTSGCYGHSTSYWRPSYDIFYGGVKGQANGVETWAEYVSLKMTRDSQGLNSFKEYLPKTYSKYEEIYNKLGDEFE